jgi:hypothetical protein
LIEDSQTPSARPASFPARIPIHCVVIVAFRSVESSEWFRTFPTQSPSPHETLLLRSKRRPWKPPSLFVARFVLRPYPPTPIPYSLRTMFTKLLYVLLTMILNPGSFPIPRENAVRRSRSRLPGGTFAQRSHSASGT